MSRGEHTPSSRSLGEDAAHLREAVQLGGAELDPQACAVALAVADRVDERIALSDRHTVVALAGVTGGGKSSLFNAIIGDAVAETGVRRPVTSQTQAAVWGEDMAPALLDWLGVSRRHRVDVARSDGDLAGLVLLDLPDFDSRETANRAEADRILAMADLFVWVTDPQKYADAVMHDEYVATHRGQDANTIVVLNHADTLGAEGVRVTTEDLTRLLRADGMERPEVVATSARTGMGVPELRARIARAVAAREAALRRLGVDLGDAATALRAGVAATEPMLDRGAQDRLVTALSGAAGVPVVLAAVERAHLREAARHTGSVFTRWVRRLRPDPLRRLRLGTATPGDGSTDAALRQAVARTSLPAPTPAARAEVEVATRGLGDAAAAGLPPRWADAVHDAATPTHGDLRDALDRAVAATPLQGRVPAWWRAVDVVQWLLALCAVAGLAWYVALMLTDWLRFSLPDVPRWGPVPYPFMLLVGGLAGGFLLAALVRATARVGARRRRAKAAARLRTAIAGVAHEHVTQPVEVVLTRHNRVRRLLAG